MRDTPRLESPKAQAKAKAAMKKWHKQNALGVNKKRRTMSRVTSPSNPYSKLIRDSAFKGEKGDT